MSNWFKFAVFFTSFIPLWISVFLIELKNIYLNKEYLNTEYFVLIFITLGLIYSIFICIIGFKGIKKKKFYREYKVVKSKLEYNVLSEYLIAYILPLFVFDFTEFFGVIQFFIYFIILAFICIRHDNININVILILLGYRLYNCELSGVSEYKTSNIEVLILSKTDLRGEVDNTIEITSLSSSLHINDKIDIDVKC